MDNIVSKSKISSVSGKSGALLKSKSIPIPEKSGALSKSKPISVTKNSSKSKPISVTNNSSNSEPLSVTGTSIKLHSRHNPRQQLEKPPIAENTALENAREELHDSMKPFTSNSIIRKIKCEVDRAENEEEQTAEITVEEVLSYGVTLLARGIRVGEASMDYLRKVLPEKIEEMINEVQKDNESKKVNGSNGKPMIGGVPQTVKGTQVNPAFKLSLFAGLPSLFAFIFLIFFLLWVIIMGLLNRFLGDNYALPNVKFKKETTQIVYSIFFAITSLVLMFYLFIDYYRKIEQDLDIVQIFKQVIGASYILWPIAILIIGSGISKAFYKISCNGNKPNVLSWAKIVESTALYVLGICVLITVMFLFKPVKYMYDWIFPRMIQKFFQKGKISVAVTLKLMVIYILLRMVTVMLEDIISNKIVFFISKLNNDVEAPSVNCNAEEEEKNAKQSEVANILEEIYMYISGIIVCIAIIFIMLIQSPHPYFASVYKINDKIGSVLLKVTDYPRKYILQNDYNEKDCSKNKTGLGFFPSLPKFGSTSVSTEGAPHNKTGFSDLAEISKTNGQEVTSPIPRVIPTDNKTQGSDEKSKFAKVYEGIRADEGRKPEY